MMQLGLNLGILALDTLRWLSGKECTPNAGYAGHMSSILGSGRSPRGGSGNPLQYSCLENPVDRGGWRATVHGVQRAGLD